MPATMLELLTEIPLPAFPLEVHRRTIEFVFASMPCKSLPTETESSADDPSLTLSPQRLSRATQPTIWSQSPCNPI